MGYTTCEVAIKFEFSRTIILRVYREYRVFGKTLNLGHQYGWEKTLKERDYRQIRRILKRGRRAILPQTVADFSDGTLLSTSVRIIPRTIINMGFRRRTPYGHRCYLHSTNL